MRSRTIWSAALALLAMAPRIGAQSLAANDSAERALARQGERAEQAVLFRDRTLLPLTLTANFRMLRRDRQQESDERPAVLTIPGADGVSVEIPIEVRTRGIFRLKNCSFPPLRFDLPGRKSRDTPFAGQDKLKVVTHCEDRDKSEQNLLLEYQIYRIYELVTPLAFRTRLARITYVDSAEAKPIATRSAILIENADALAARNGGRIIEFKQAAADQLDGYNNALVGLFQYLIRNTDWSTASLHNIELVQTVLATRAVPYDFDFAGLIAADYAAPNPDLRIRSVRERLYRGLCAPEADLARAVARFNEQRGAIEAVFAEPIGVEEWRNKRARDDIEDFYRTINDPGRLRRDVAEACLKIN